MNRRRSNLTFYLILNIVVSAATTLAVLAIWDRARREDIPALPPIATEVAGTQAVATAAAQVEPLPTRTMPPTGDLVIQIVSVVGAGDLGQEVIMLRRLGEGNLRLSGWSLRGDGGSIFTFPEQPELVLYKGGAVQVYTKPGTDTATDIYWNRTEPAWRSGETIQVLDSEGNQRAVYRIP